MSAKIRLYVEQPLGQGQSVRLDKSQAHYLFGVMRLALGAQVLLFNGKDGEWRADVVEVGKKSGVLVAQDQTKPLSLPPDLWLMFAPIKKARTDFIVEKAAEMGAAQIMPVMTAFTNAGRVQRDRLQAHAVEAAEQCGGTYVPQVTEAIKLDRLLADWDPARRLLFCDEGLVGHAQTDLATLGRDHPWAILIGPEGGFSEKERARLHACDFATSIALGPRILRADTAAVAALTMWQSTLGDWR